MIPANAKSNLGCIKKPGIFLNDPKSLFSFVFSYRFLTWWAPCRQEVWNFQLSVGVKASLVESQQMSSFVFISFHRLSFCIHFLSCSFHFAFISFILLSCPFMFRRYDATYQRYRSSKDDCKNGQVGIRPTPGFLIFRRPVSLIRSIVATEHERTWEQNERKWMQNERNMRGNECKMKGDERKWKQKMTFVDSRPRMLSHPQKAGNFTLLVYRELTREKTIRENKRKKWFGVI